MSMTYKQADKLLTKVGAAHATGEALAAMMALNVHTTHGGNAETYYNWIVKQADFMAAGKLLVRDRATAWDLLLGIEPTETDNG